MTEPEAIEALEKVLELADADAVEAMVSGGLTASTRFADNVITQNVQNDSVSLAVSCAYGQSHGTVSSNDLSEDSLKDVVDRAQAIARVSPPDPEYMPPVGKEETRKYPNVEGCFEQTARFSPLEKAGQISAAAETVEAKGFRLSGAYEHDNWFMAVANSAGLRAYHRETMGEIHATVLTPTSSGWAEKMSNNIDDIDVRNVADRALAIAEMAQNGTDFEPGRYTVIMRPAAVAELLSFMFFDGFDAKASDEGRTFLRGKLCTKICGQNITLRSDASDPRCPGMPFQPDGLASPTITWIDKGVVTNLFYSRYWAKKQGKEASGVPSNFIMDGGDATVDEMIALTKMGLLITRFWYIRFVDSMVPLVTGMTRDGLFLIENGEVTRPIKYLRFNENPVDVLNRVEAMSAPERTGEYMGMLVPALKVREFNFTSTTKF